MRSERRRSIARSVGIAVVGVVGVVGVVVVTSPSPRARAQEHDHGQCERPLTEVSTWLALGGGNAWGRNEPSRALFDMRLGTDATFPLHRDGDRRFGPWLEVSTSTFATFAATGGLELLMGAAPRRFHLFQYDGEGVLSVRAGAGWTLRRASFPGASSAPVVSFTLAWGYRAPWDLWDSWECECSEPSPEDGAHPCRRGARYMTPVRFYVSVQRELAAENGWQVTGGLEFEPLGSFRYLLGLY